MLFSILAFLLSIVPSVLIIVWMKKRGKGDALYQKNCNYALILGLVCALPIVIVSGTLSIMNGVLRMTVLKDIPVLVYKLIYNFVVLALAEEIVKYVALRLVLKKKNYAYTWADVAAFMVVIGTAFGLVEDIPYAIGADAITMLVRGLTMGHVGYGFLMGWFYGKKLFTGKKIYGVIAIILPWLIHGLYDFSLTPELIEWNDNLVIIAILLALFDLVALILTIRFFIRAKKHKNERYHQPLITVTEETAPEKESAEA